jgi:antitoxin YefM
MRTVTFTDARNGLKSVLDGVADDADVAIITRRDAEDAVVMSLDHYNSLMETVHLLKSPANAAHLAESIAQYRAGSAFERDTVADQQ